MSRIPQPSHSSARTPAKLLTPSTGAARSRTPTASGARTPTPPTRVRTKSTPSKPTPRRPSPDKEPPLPKPAVSLRDVIAQKRAEAKKALTGSKPANGIDFAGADPLTWNKPAEEDVSDLGRWSLRETIERARTSGNINLCSRDLPCLPSALFEIHLGVTPAPLESVPDQPVLPPNDDSAPRRRAGKVAPTWFDAQDLEVIKAWNNRIVEIHPEISLFGSLKNIDLHNNHLSRLPESFADLTALTTLDVSHNSLQSLPENFFALPGLTILNLAHNELTSLPFQHPFTPENMQRLRKRPSGGFFTPDIYRADAPLPALRTLDVSFNKICASSVDHNLPASINKFDISSNPLRSGCGSLLKALGRLSQLKELRCNQAEIGNDAFPANLFVGEGHLYPKIQVLDLGETKVTEEAVSAALSTLNKELNFDATADEPPEGVLKVLVGKKIVKEAWELEAEKWGRRKGRSPARDGHDDPSTTVPTAATPVVKEPWEIEAEQGLLTEGGRRRARAAAVATTNILSVTPSPVVIEEPQKEPWELGAEEGLSAGALRLRRAKAAEATQQPIKAEQPSSANGMAASLANSKYYSANTFTLALPASTALSNKGGLHARSYSVNPFGSSQPSSTDLAIPTPTLPLTFIATQSIAQTLKVLELNNRRMDPSFSLPSSSHEPLLPSLEELSFEGCGLRDPISTSYGDQTNRTSEALLPLLAKLFPNLISLNLTYNAISSQSLTTDALSTLILDKATPLRHLHLRGNRITHLDGFQGLAEHFKGHREVPTWKLEELDLRDNEIGKLPAELGLLPLDVLLVDGNTFRVPARRIWEREGTKGLLSWLRGRLE